MKNKTLSYSILGITFILLSVIAFIVPVHKTSTFWIGYIFTAVAFLAQVFIWNFSFKGCDTLKSKFLGFPIVYVGVCFLSVQVIAFAIFLFIPFAPAWISIITFVLILGISSVCLVTTEIGRTEVSRIEKRVYEKAYYLRGLQVDIELIAENCNDNYCKKALISLVEKIKYSDPMSNNQLHDLEIEITNRVNELKFLKEKCSIQRIMNIEALVEERNKKCKILK